MKSDINPIHIRKCEFITVNDVHMIQFIATGDRHQMIKEDDGTITMVKMPEQGKDYRYGDPFMPMVALDILNHNAHPSHESMAQKLRARMNGQ